MTKVRLLALLAVVALVLFPAIAFAQGAPQLPCAFHGTVQVNGANVADGTVITATIGNATYTATTTNSTYRVTIPAPTTGSYDGMTATFMIGSATASQTGTWSMGGNVALNLTQGTPVVSPGGITDEQLKAKIQEVVTANAATLKGATGATGATGAAGATGATGATGPAGKNGKDASIVFGIVALIIAIIAILIAGMVMLRKPKAQQAQPPKT